MEQLRKLQLNRADYVRTEKTKKEVEKLESQMMVASQAIETTSAEIIKLREIELYPQLIGLVTGLVFFFHSCHAHAPSAVGQEPSNSQALPLLFSRELFPLTNVVGESR